jgi:NDP-sugar pyrophosphorylase family protein
VLDIVIPMAGRGSRFTKVGFVMPKPLIDVKGKTMIERVVGNLTCHADHRFIFLVLAEHLKQYDLEGKLRHYGGPQTVIVPVDQVTEGAACTVLLAEKSIDTDQPLMIANSDQLVDIDINDYVDGAIDSGLDGSIMIFRDHDPKWSFAAIDKQGYVTEVAEKRPISDLATVGIYFFKSGRQFCSAARQMIRKNIRVNNEFYVCPVYNEMIASGAKIKTYEIEMRRMHGLGTPEDLKIYLEKFS